MSTGDAVLLATPRGPCREQLDGKNSRVADTNTDMRTQVQQERELGEVVAWRRDQLVQSGFPRQLAAQLALDARFDLHALIELVEHGCAPRLAVRILAPLEADPRRSSTLLPSTAAS